MFTWMPNKKHDFHKALSGKFYLHVLQKGHHIYIYFWGHPVHLRQYFFATVLYYYYIYILFVVVILAWQIVYSAVRSRELV